MPVLKIAAARGSDDETILEIVDSNGVPVDLTAAGATAVYATICDGGYACNSQRIDVDFANDRIFPQFGGFAVRPGKYRPKITYELGDGTVKTLVAHGFNTEILLSMAC